MHFAFMLLLTYFALVKSIPVKHKALVLLSPRIVNEGTTPVSSDPVPPKRKAEKDLPDDRPTKKKAQTTENTLSSLSTQCSVFIFPQKGLASVQVTGPSSDSWYKQYKDQVTRTFNSVPKDLEPAELTDLKQIFMERCKRVVTCNVAKPTAESKRIWWYLVCQIKPVLHPQNIRTDTMGVVEAEKCANESFAEWKKIEVECKSQQRLPGPQTPPGPQALPSPPIDSTEALTTLPPPKEDKTGELVDEVAESKPLPLTKKKGTSQ